ncbi:MAG TPA: GC-type dockerin domain-anchored protein, partial [Phycisphaerales bacterium]|nr:GC-type dockerin domain-anchored protein [Phycisphaerales bacterium]
PEGELLVGGKFTMAGGGISVSLARYGLGINAACPADVDCSGALSTLDIFAFLDAWFTGDSTADFNGADGVSTQDIFDFLNAWFVGC